MIRRRALLAAFGLLILPSMLFGQTTAAPLGTIVRAVYSEPTARYDHGILGDAIEWGALDISVRPCLGCGTNEPELHYRFRLPENRVFEDIAPRLIRGENRDGSILVMVVETDLDLGARLAIYNQRGLYAATPFIGRSHRWLAPIGAADLDGDGFLEIAYIDRPHLAKRLRVWRLQGGELRLVAEMDGLTNHQIGWDHIPGGIANCVSGMKMFMASADWQRVMSVQLIDGELVAQDRGAYESPRALNYHLGCLPN